MKTLFTLLLVIFTLTGCSGGSGGSKSAKEYTLYPTNYLSTAFTESYSLTGKDTFFIQYEGTYDVETQTEATFDGDPTFPSFGLLRFTNKLTNTSFVVPSTTYYSTSLLDLEVLGFYDSLQGLTTASADTSVIPLTAKIGDYGDIGTYIDNVGNTSIYTWELSKAKDGKAYFTIEGSVTDQFDTETGTIENSFEIDTDGNRSSMSIIVFYAKTGITIKLSGPRI